MRSKPNLFLLLRVEPDHMTKSVLLVGSVPLRSSEEVFKEVSKRPRTGCIFLCRVSAAMRLILHAGRSEAKPRDRTLSGPHSSERWVGRNQAAHGHDGFVANHGVAAECCFGRRPPETVLDLLDLYQAVAERSAQPCLARQAAVRRIFVDGARQFARKPRKEFFARKAGLLAQLLDDIRTDGFLQAI